MQINCVGIHDPGMAFVRNVALTVDDTRFATAHADGTTRIWTIGQTQPELLGLLQGYSAAVHYVAFSRDAAVVATASEDGTARLWTLGGSTPPKLHLTLAADGRALQYITLVASGALTVDFDGHVRFWNLNSSGSAADSIELANKRTSQDTPIATAEVDYSGLYLFSISKNHVLCLWTDWWSDLYEGERAYSKQMKHIGCIRDVLDARFAYFERPRKKPKPALVFITSDGIVHFWKTSYWGDKFEPVFDLDIFDAKGNPRFLSFAQDGKHLLIFAERQHLWRAQVPWTPFESIMTGCALMSRTELAGSGNKDLPDICSRSQEAIERLSGANTRLEGVSGW